MLIPSAALLLPLFRFVSMELSVASVYLLPSIYVLYDNSEFNSFPPATRAKRSESLLLQSEEDCEWLVPSDDGELSSRTQRKEGRNRCILFHPSAITWSHSQNTKCTLLLIIVLLVRWLSVAAPLSLTASCAGCQSTRVRSWAHQCHWKSGTMIWRGPGFAQLCLCSQLRGKSAKKSECSRLFCFNCGIAIAIAEICGIDRMKMRKNIRRHERKWWREQRGRRERRGRKLLRAKIPIGQRLWTHFNF